MDTENVDPVEFVRKVAEVNFVKICEESNHLREAYTTTSHWIMASLLIVNGGGAINFCISDKVELCGRQFAGVLWIFGIIFALLMGYTTARRSSEIQPYVRKLGDFWFKIGQHQGKGFEQKSLDDCEKKIFDAQAPWAVSTERFGWLSALCFFVGAIMVDFDLK